MAPSKDPPYFCVCVNDDHDHGTADCPNPSAVDKDGRYLHDRLCEFCFQAELDGAT